MQSYTDLIKALRYCMTKEDGITICEPCPYYGNGIECENVLHTDAAAAIEELQAKLHAKESSAKRWRRLATDMADYVDAVRCGECKHYDPLDKSRPFFCPIMNCEDGVMEDDYCSRGERRAKMEVQDVQGND